MPQQSLADSLLSPALSDMAVRQRFEQIRADLLRHSRVMREPNFNSIHTDDLGFLFRAYDGAFFEGRFAEALRASPLAFRFSRRMTKAGGSTLRLRNPLSGETRYEITIATSLLFEGFGAADRGVTVCGLECPTRLDALQRIFEHELIHLGEQLCWDTSSCSAPRFQGIAARQFGHAAHTHALITRRERAAEAGIHVGSVVSFAYEGRRLSGRVNRITKRASVLVPDPGGRLFTDGGRYVTYYVPIGTLTAHASA